MVMARLPEGFLLLRKYRGLLGRCGRFVAKGLGILSLWFVVGAPVETYALPIGFGINQDQVEYSELVTPHFYVYFDKRVPTEGRMALEALEKARRPLETWFMERRSRPLPVIMSAVTEDASFANFVVDALEVQSMGQGPKALFLHEYVHQAMYRTLDNFLGPIGNILHLPWLPAWFIEGLADSLAVTVGPDGQSGVERYQALSGDWPTYDRLHSLYIAGPFSYQGYATSAGLVRFFLKKLGPDRLAEFMKDLRAKTMPWWWPYSIVPFADALPFDRALRKYIKMNGEELYELYKKEAHRYWSARSESHLLRDFKPQEPRQRERSPLFLSNAKQSKGYLGFDHENSQDPQGRSLQHRHHDHIVARLSGAMGFTESFSAAELNVDDLVFDPETGMATKKKKKSSMSGDPLINPSITEEKASNYQVTSKIKLRGSVIKRPGVVKGYTVTPSLLIWSEDDFAVSRICYTKRQKKMPKKPEVTCPLVVEQPQSLAIIGRKPLQKASGENLRGEFAEIWVSLKEERPSGTVFTVSAVDGETGQIVGKSGDYFVRPVDMVFRQDGSWILFGERTRQSIRKFDASLRCQSMIVFKDYITGLGVTEKDQWVFGFYTPRGMIARLISDRQGHQLKEVPCDTPVPLITPLEVAMAQAQDLGSAPDSGPDTVVRLSQALERTEFWEEKRENTADEGWRQSWEKGVQAEKPLGHAEGSKPSVKDRTWRGRPVFLVPWIGAEDALGYQLGAVSVPLMDHLQNETIRATVLVGVSSRFPYQEIALTSTRFQPTYNMVVYRQQTYNGQLRLRSTNELKTSYLDEKGMRFEVSRPTRIFGLAGSVDGGVKVADLKPYLGPTVRGRGVLVEPTLSISVSKKVLDTVNLNASVSGRAAPRGLNKVWDYNQTGFNTSASRRLNLLSSNLSIGLEGSRTRGRAKRDFTESYRPLKTFIPGSGGGYNQNNFPISNEGSGLFSGQYGDSQARAKVDWTFPLIKDVDQLFWIIYAESLDFTAFYNYGGAWKGAAPPKGWNHLTSAHGYNLDLQMENKGVRFNAGIGTGQVVGKKFEVYMTTGFDALF